MLIAAATDGHLVKGLAWFAVLAAGGGLSAIAGHIDAARGGRADIEEHRAAMINARAMSITGTVLVIALTGCIAFTLARGESTSPYIPLLGIGGIAYVAALVTLRRRS